MISCSRNNRIGTIYKKMGIVHRFSFFAFCMSNHSKHRLEKNEERITKKSSEAQMPRNSFSNQCPTYT